MYRGVAPGRNAREEMTHQEHHHLIFKSTNAPGEHRPPLSRSFPYILSLTPVVKFPESLIKSVHNFMSLS